MTRKMDARFANGRHVAAETQQPHRKQARRIIVILTAPLAALAFAAAFAAPAHALTVVEQGWQVANSKCKDGDAKECELRDRLSAKLKRQGCLYHEDGDWWKCSGAR
jgi:invasion protein IalB